MTSYHGGKQRIGLTISDKILLYIPIIAKDKKINIEGYCEPFCGMLGVYKHVYNTDIFKDKNMYAGDINLSVIKMWRSLQDNWKPPNNVSKEEYNKLRYDGNSSALKGYVGHLFTMRGIYFSTYFSHTQSRLDCNRKRVIGMGKKMQNIIFSHGTYDQFSHLKGYVIYCDPPYSATQQKYYNEKGELHYFNYNNFIKWCIKMSKYNIIFISDYNNIEEFNEIPMENESKEKLFWI